jgi:predicted enzyme related to lactoylglutathione lyase
MTPSLYSVAIFVRNIDQAKVFYRDHLGLVMTKEGSFGAEFLDGPTHLGVHPAIHPDAQALVGRHTGVTLQVEDLREYCERLRQHGVRVLTEPTQQTWGIMAMISDPEGNIFALWENRLPSDPGT